MLTGWYKSPLKGPSYFVDLFEYFLFNSSITTKPLKMWLVAARQDLSKTTFISQIGLVAGLSWAGEVSEGGGAGLACVTQAPIQSRMQSGMCWHTSEVKFTFGMPPMACDMGGG